MKYAIIKDNKIDNIIIADDTFASSIGAIQCSENDAIGDNYLNGVFSKDVIVKTFTESKAEKLQSLNTWHDSQISAMKAKYSSSEVESFLDKRNEAMAVRKDPLAKTPYIDAMSGGVAEVRTMLIDSILAKVDATAQLEMHVLMTRDTIEVCTTQEQLDAIIW